MGSTPIDPHGPDAASPTPPVCPRHPGRAAYVRCASCGTPVCLECQRPGPGGSVLCPDDTARLADAGPAATPSSAPAAVPGPGATTLRGRLAAMPVSWALMATTLVVFAGQWLTLASPDGVTEHLWYAGLYTSGRADEPWRLLTYAFVHDVPGLTHVGLNLLAVWMLGRVLEPLLGGWRLLCLYLLSAVGGGVFALWTTHPLQPVVGASGAVYGLFAALFLLTRAQGGQVRSITVLIALNLVFSFLMPGISWQVHVGGLITGAVVGGIYTTAGGASARRGPTRGDGGTGVQRRTAAGAHAAGLVLVAAALALLTLAGSSRVDALLAG